MGVHIFVVCIGFIAALFACGGGGGGDSPASGPVAVRQRCPPAPSPSENSEIPVIFLLRTEMRVAVRALGCRRWGCRSSWEQLDGERAKGGGVSSSKGAGGIRVPEGRGVLRMNKHPHQRQAYQCEMSMLVPVRSSIPRAMHDDGASF